MGPRETATRFVEAWQKKTGAPAKLAMAQMIYKLETAQLPKVNGKLRQALPNEVELVAQWSFEFAHESLPPREHYPIEVYREASQRLISSRPPFIWEVDGEPVSIAQASRHTKNGSTVSFVYTPKPLRRNGFASAVVAHLSQYILDSGKKFCVLYTDLSNPTSNKIYQDVGYREVTPSKHYLFE